MIVKKSSPARDNGAANKFAPALACVPSFACIKCLIRFSNDFFALLWTTIREVSWIRRGRRRRLMSRAENRVK